MASLSLTRRAAAPVVVAYCKVDDSSGPIAPGDLLVPSTTTFGHAMRAPYTNRDSSVIGEALAPFDGGCGLIPITLSADQSAVMRKQQNKQHRQKMCIYKLLSHR